MQLLLIVAAFWFLIGAKSVNDNGPNFLRNCRNLYVRVVFIFLTVALGPIAYGLNWLGFPNDEDEKKG